MAIDQDAYVTLVNSDSYLPGAAVLAHSLRDSGTSKKLVCMVTQESLKAETLAELKTLFDHVIPVDRIHNPNPANLYLLNRGDLLYAFTKINVWRLVQFRKIVFLDADVVALRAPDELFDIDSPFSAAPDIGWPDAFNTGVMALKPNMGTYWALHTLAASGNSFDGADQGLLNQYYAHKDWHRLSFTYNCTPNASYQYEPAYRYYKSKISMVHFIGKQKPWVTGRSGKGESLVYKELVNQWWAVYDSHYRDMPTVVQRYVAGEEYRANNSYSPSVPLGLDPEASLTAAEPALTDPPDTAEAIAQEVHVAEERRFSPPVNSWDATRAPPPAESKPEAQNFPHQTYTMSSDPHLFNAPKAYPEPPKDMWYKVPESKPALAQRPKPIFPWEERKPARPSRVFSDDIASPPPEPAPPALTDFPTSAAGTRPPAIKVTEPEAHGNTFGLMQNVWDGDAGIDSYIRQMSRLKKLRGSVQVLHGGPRQAQTPTDEEAPNNAGRRESIVLTDFPSAIERPSLPVTPAPVRKAFWGEERDSAGNLPQAEGVPSQVDWDPSTKLEELRRHSLQMDPSSMTLPSKNVPRRDMPRSSIIEEESERSHVRFQTEQPPHPSTRQATAASSATPSFTAVDFAHASGSSREDVMSPTEHGKSDLA